VGWQRTKGSAELAQELPRGAPANGATWVVNIWGAINR
jgi:hypothetical protein